MSEDSFIAFTCPKCGNAVEYSEDCAGSAQPCPYCGEDVLVPRGDNAEGSALPLPIETPRLSLRKLQPEDLPDALEILSDPETFQYEERPPMDEDEAKRWLERVVKEKLSDISGQLTLGIALHDGGKLIGLAWIRYTDSNRQQASVGIQIHGGFKRRGFGFEGFRAVLAFCLRDIGLHRVITSCDSRNAGAVRLFGKLGMRNEAECLRDRFVDGEWADTRWFAMLDQELPQTN
ncbi:MAG TPA: GNAT family N-acetyltransferase [Verrucomicrobiae bacterium]|nr:GNAT family N-acetyltransferase [Verrucomicrobiae bacterium]